MARHNSTRMAICFLSIFKKKQSKIFDCSIFWKFWLLESFESTENRFFVFLWKFPLFLYKLLHSQVYPPGVFVQTALRSQLWVSIKHSLISSHSVPGNCRFKSMKPGRHVQKNPPLLLVQVALGWQLWSPVPHLSMPRWKCWQILVTENCWQEELTWLKKFLEMFQKI